MTAIIRPVGPDRRLWSLLGSRRGGLEPRLPIPNFIARRRLNGLPAARSPEEGLVSRVSMFNSPLLLGFDQLERTLDRLAKNAEGYPPYNIEKVGENGLRITLAVAGFASADLAIELVENQLTVRGKQVDDSDRVFLHRGIAARQFQRAFMLADGIEVIGARLDNGLLSIELARPAAEPRIRTIRIDAGGATPATSNTIDINARRNGPR
jgi:HSP20 family molecular chaperone IbpA